MINHVKKVWGSEDWLVLNNLYCAKFLNLNRGYECSVHYHAIKDETFYILAGEIELFTLDLKELPVKSFDVKDKVITAYVELGSEGLEKKMKRHVLKHGDQFRLQPYVAHKFRSLTFAAKLLEVSTTHMEDDSYRLTESRKL
jgi:D-lyxose ketol-isomerase